MMMSDRLPFDSPYTTPSELNNSKHINNENLSMLHINCRSLKKNFDFMNIFLDCFDVNFSVIGLTETWLKRG